MITVKAKMVYLAPLGTTKIGSSDGTKTFKNAGDVFKGGVEGEELPLSQPVKTSSAMVAIYKQVANSTLIQALGSLGDVQQRWQQNQVVDFCCYQPGKLRAFQHGNFFLLAEPGYVADVRVMGVEVLRVTIHPFFSTRIWY